MDITKTESYELYVNRTIEHIHRVHKNMAYLVTKCRDFNISHKGELFDLSDSETCRELMHTVLKHDRSKFNQLQFEPYIHLTEYYHQRKKLGNDEYDYPSRKIREAVDKAVILHYHQENHHPERLEGKAELMTYGELVEVCCDLQSMADEFNEGSCRGYFENVWIKKQSNNFYDDFDWEFTKMFMSKVIELFERRF